MVRKEVLVKYLREQIVKCKETHCYQSAIFYADKVVTLCKDSALSPEYVSSLYELAQCYFCNKEYLRVVQLLDKSGLSFHNERFRILLGQAFFFAGNYEESINVLEANLMEETSNPAADKCFTDLKEQCYFQSLKYLILGKAYEAQENKTFAVQNFKEALKANCENVEAFERLISNYLLPHEEKLHLLDDIKFSDTNGWLKDYYLSRIHQNFISTDSGYIECEEVSETPVVQPMTGIKKKTREDTSDKRLTRVPVLNLLKANENCDVVNILADKYYKEQDARKSYELIKGILDYDFYYLQVVPLYCACLIELEKPGELYYLAHKLVTSNPSLAVAWFAVGSYYFLIKKYDIARKYYQKANQLDKDFAASWTAFGHCFAAQNESDQAMAAYRTAARLFPGCYVANLCIGMEYLRTNNLKTAMLSFQEALKIYDKDPSIYNEIGVIQYKSKMYSEAKVTFTKGLELCIDLNSTTYETLSKNLAHTYRKLMDYENAIKFYERSLRINPKCASTYTALGFTHHLKEDYKQALACYHKASFLKSDDPLTNELIAKAMVDINETNIELAY